MDRQSIIGIVIIGVLMLGFFYVTRPDRDQIEQEQRRRDSIEQAQQKIEDSVRMAQEVLATEAKDTISETIAEDFLSEEELLQRQESDRIRKYGVFADASIGEEEFFTIENNLMKIVFSSKGGKIYSVELKDYQTYYGDPLIMYDTDSVTSFGLEMIADGKTLLTNDMFFTPVSRDNHRKITSGSEEIKMQLKINNNKHIEYVYTIDADDYMIDFDINIVGLHEELAVNPYIILKWSTMIPSLERKESDWESDNTTIYVKMENGDLEKLRETRDFDEFQSSARVHWVAFKQQFFSSVLIGKDDIDNPIVQLMEVDDPEKNYLKKFDAEVSFPFDRSANKNVGFNFYFGPNNFTKLKSYDIGMEKLVPLGWGIFGWVNRLVTIPIFNWLGGFINSYGLIILLLTLIIKLVLFPLTYKSYLSSAKMRILKPQVDELGKKYPKGKEMDKQQAVMSLYKKAGASPLGGCLPILLQFPILIALFRFFPASIELRQESLFWAEDLSTYDSILSLPFEIPFYGEHVSLFTLLMALSMVVMTKLTSSNQAANPNMPGMKTMMYMMPVFMVIWFNSYASGLSYYYFLANLITIVQTLIIRNFIIDEEKVLAAMEAKKKKPIKKSKWAKRLEEAQKKAKQKQNRKR